MPSTGPALFALGLFLAAPPSLAASPSGGPDCASFGGKIHGTSTCVRVSLATFALEPLAARVMPGPGTKSVRCGGALKLAGARVALECVPGRAAPGVVTNKTGVWLRIERDGKAPRRLELDVHVGFQDFINAWLSERDGGLDVTIDYGILD